MSVTIRLGTISKRRNSTKQPADTDLADVRSVDLKDTTSYDAPTFLLTGNDLAYNYLKWGNRYYFINDVRSVRHNLIEVECILDVLATYKTEILASTQFVSYSASHAGNATWLPDTRIPVLKQTEVDSNIITIDTLFSSSGFFALTVVGRSGCVSYAVTKQNLLDLISGMQSWLSSVQNVYNNLPATPTSSTETGAIDSLTEYIKFIYGASINSDFLGNQYIQAPQCIRSCIWVPFQLASFQTGSSQRIFLGNYDTGVDAVTIKAEPATGYKSVSIPWFHNDWRRAYCEDVYIYLPLVGIVQLASDSITNASSIIVNYSATATDGCVCYELVSGGEIIGTYGGQASANYPIGINQQASAGQIAQSILQGAEKMVSCAIDSSISPVSMAAVTGGVALEGVAATYNTLDVANSTNLTCIGGIGGGAGAGLPLSFTCYVVNHETIVAPSAMAATMGRPYMKPRQLGGNDPLSGYCQCANAHVEAPAQASELDALDSYLNSGFYIE